MEGEELVLKINKLRKKNDKQAIMRLLRDRYIRLEGANETERMKALRDEVADALPKSTFYRYANEGSWERDRQEVRDAAEMTTHGKELMEIAGKRAKDIPMSVLAGEIKDYGYTALKVTKTMTETGSTMIMYYGAKIKTLIEQQGGVEKLQLQHMAKIKIWEDKLERYYNMVAPFVNPTAVASYMRLIGLEQAVSAVPDDLELGLLTPAKLVMQLKEVGMQSMFGNQDAVMELGRKVGMGDLPDINAISVVDEQNLTLRKTTTVQEVMFTSKKKRTLEDLDNEN